jgi:hypothetical protein
MQQDSPGLHKIFNIVWEQWRAIVNMVMSFRVFQMTENVLTSQAAIDLSCRILFHGVVLLRNGHKTDFLRKFGLKK